MSSRGPTDDARVLVRLLRIAWDYRAQCLLALAVQLLLLAATVLGLSLSGVALDVLRCALDPHAAPVRWPLGLQPPARLDTWTLLLGIAAAIVVLGGLRALCGYAYAMLVARLVQGEIVPALRARVYAKLQQLSFRFFDQKQSASLLNRVTSDVQYLRSFVDGVLIQSVVMLLAATVYGAYSVSKHAGLALACLATLPWMWLRTLRFSRRVLPAYSDSRERMDRFVLAVSETIAGIAVVKGFAIEPHTQADVRAKNRDVRDSQHAIFGKVSAYTGSMDVLTHASNFVLLGYGGALVVSGALSVGDLVVFGGLLQQFSLQVTNMATIVNTLQESLVGAQRVFEVLDAVPEIATPRAPAPCVRRTGHVRLEGVAFEYVPGQAALADIELELSPGECVALCGAAGSGKSTLLSLLPRFYDPTRGRVLVHGRDAREHDLEALRRSIAVVFQESFLFSHTVAHNIAFGHPEATRAQIEAAARRACAHEFIAELPYGYDTLLGELAVNLSGGQRQRLAIARALMSEPQILLLDDPVAALDAETTHQVVTSLRAAAAGRSTLVVTHCTALLQQADRILVLDHGRIVQQGNHANLSRARGPYSQNLRLHKPDTTARQRDSVV